MMHPETLLAHAGCRPDPATGAVTSPIHLSTTFEREADGSYPTGFFYSRADNPNRRQLEELTASLEGGAAAAAFGSGMAASMAVLQALKPGDHVLFPDDVYHGVRYLLETIFSEWGLRATVVDLSDLPAVEAVLEQGVQLVWAETPSNPMLKITDLTAVAERAHAAGARLIVDGTWTTPLLQCPLDFGADLVLHSVTKYLAGHSDVLGGIVVARTPDDFFNRIRTVQTAGGPVLDPFSAWLTMRGMRSLAARLHVQCASAARIADFLADCPRIAQVNFPGLASHPGHDIARRQMKSFGAMLSFQVEGDRSDAMAVAGRVRLFTRATSLGGTESLIEHRASIETQPTRTPENLLRVSVGLEHVDDLLADLSQALNG